MPAAAIVGAAAIGGASSIISGNRAASATRDAANSANATQLQMYNQSREDQAPWRTVGSQALTALSQQLGLAGPSGQQDGGGAPAAPDYSQFYKTPGYDFRLSQGVQALDRSAAARGLLRSGAQAKAVTRYGQDYGSAEYGNYLNRLDSLAGVGQTSAANIGQQGIATGQMIGQNTMNAGNARASAYQNTGSAINGLIGQGAGLYGMAQGGYFSPSFGAGPSLGAGEFPAVGSLFGG